MDLSAAFVLDEKYEYSSRPVSIYIGNVFESLLNNVPNTIVSTMVVRIGSRSDQMIPR
jgi:hypothetical protein